MKIEQHEVQTVPALLLRSANTFPKADAFKFKEMGRWVDVSMSEFVLRVEELFFGLRTLGVRPGDRVCILSENRLEWAISDYAITALGAITVPIYPTLSAPQVEYLLRNSEARVLLASSYAQVEKINSIRANVPDLKFVIAFDKNVYQPGIIRLEMVLKIGKQSAFEQPQEFVRTAQSVQPEDVATIIYTSGTTGVPKGAMLTHRNLMSNMLATLELFPIGPKDIELSFLPLSHVFQRHVDYAALCVGSTIAYAESLLTVADDMVEVKPTFAAAVPRFFEKIHAKIMAQVATAPAIRRKIFLAAMDLSPKSPFRKVADRIVFSKIREKLGGRIRWFISGGAALDPSLAEFFNKVGLPILEGYGMTETGPVITFTSPEDIHFGRVGRPIGDIEVKIADDGEILVRGSNVMKGYFKMERETAQVFRDGWFHTGDIGRLDADGLQITDRKKDLIVTSSGKNIAPQLLETRLRRIPYLENVVVVGDGRNFVSALVVPNYDVLATYARAQGIAFEQPQELTNRQEIYEMIMREINNQISDLAEFEKIKKIAFVDREFSIASGDLTPTLKVRRGEITKKYQLEIERLYAA